MLRDKESKEILMSLKRSVDHLINDVIATAKGVVFYSYNNDTNTWNKTSIAGTLFLYSRKKDPFYNFIIMNTNPLKNFIEEIHLGMEIEENDSFLECINNKKKFGLLFYNKEECENVMRELFEIQDYLKLYEDNLVGMPKVKLDEYTKFMLEFEDENDPFPRKPTPSKKSKPKPSESDKKDDNEYNNFNPNDVDMSETNFQYNYLPEFNYPPDTTNSSGNYSHQLNYPPKGNYLPQTGYPSQSYDSLCSGYMPHSDYTPEVGNLPQSGYSAQSGYPSKFRYPSEHGFSQKPPYPTQPEFPSQPGYSAQPGYSHQSGFPSQPGFPSQTGYPHQIWNPRQVGYSYQQSIQKGFPHTSYPTNNQFSTVPNDNVRQISYSNPSFLQEYCPPVQASENRPPEANISNTYMMSDKNVYQAEHCQELVYYSSNRSVYTNTSVKDTMARSKSLQTFNLNTSTASFNKSIQTNYDITMPTPKNVLLPADDEIPQREKESAQVILPKCDKPSCLVKRDPGSKPYKKSMKTIRFTIDGDEAPDSNEVKDKEDKLKQKKASNFDVFIKNSIPNHEKHFMKALTFLINNEPDILPKIHKAYTLSLFRNAK